MRSLLVFNQISLDGYFTDDHGDLSWAHKSDPEWDKFTNSNAQSTEGVLLFGRVTYEMMLSFWPTPEAEQQAPEVAHAMNQTPKVVFSRTLREAKWANTRITARDPVEEVRALKREPGGDLLLMGSGTIVSRLAQADLIDRYQIVVIPIVLGKGRTMFEGVEDRKSLKLTQARPFENGNVVLSYERAG